MVFSRNECVTIEEFNNTIKKPISEGKKMTIVESLVDNFNTSQETHPAHAKYHGDKILEAIIDGGNIEEINNIFKDKEFKKRILKEYPDNSLIKILFDQEYTDSTIKKCKLILKEDESLYGLYLRSSENHDIRSLIDFALQNPDIINDGNIDTIYSINGEIIAQNVLYEGNIRYQRFKQDPVTKIYNHINSVEKTPFETAEQALNDMKKMINIGNIQSHDPSKYHNQEFGRDPDGA